ncbi:MAG: hypothetical protein DIU60_007405 [Actinomycetes bacterium]|jgi:adenosine deaminase|nr:MAG: hypothetical protein DIU60_07080 [Actinomycetota bacterium]
MPPKAKRNVHIEGTLEPELVVAPARRNGVALPVADADWLRARYRFRGLQSFLDVLGANMAAPRTERDFSAMAPGYLRRARDNGVRRAEIFVDLRSHLARACPWTRLSRGSRRPSPTAGGRQAAACRASVMTGIRSGPRTTRRHLARPAHRT